MTNDEMWADVCPVCHHHDPDREHGNVGCEPDFPDQPLVT